MQTSEYRGITVYERTDAPEGLVNFAFVLDLQWGRSDTREGIETLIDNILAGREAQAERVLIRAGY
jgi:hypothetical protein